MPRQDQARLLSDVEKARISTLNYPAASPTSSPIRPHAFRTGDVSPEDHESYQWSPASSYNHQPDDRAVEAHPGPHTWSCVANLANAAIGAGIVAFPQAFAYTGIVTGIGVTLCVMLLTTCGLFILARAAIRARESGMHHVRSYQATIAVTLGPVGRWIAVTALLCYLMGALLLYLLLIPDNLVGTLPPLETETSTPTVWPNVTDAFGTADGMAAVSMGGPIPAVAADVLRIDSVRDRDAAATGAPQNTTVPSTPAVPSAPPPAATEGPGLLPVLVGVSEYPRWLSRQVVLVAVAVIVVFPLCLLREVRYLEWTSGLAIAFAVYLAGLVVYKGVMVVRLAEIPAGLVVGMAWHRGVEMLFAVPVVAFAFQCDTMLVPILSELPPHRLTMKTASTVITSTMALCTVAYTLTGVLGYIAFGPDVSSDVSLALGKWPAALVARGGLVFISVASYALLVHAVRLCVQTIFLGESRCFTKTEWFAATVGIFVVTTGAATAMAPVSDVVGDVVGFIGATMAVLIMFVLPGCVLFKSSAPHETFARAAGVGLAVVGVVVGSAAVVANTMKIVGS
eukprot:TRINITY_DN3240_c0_g1_i2.p1 TRINITY_DN3240_c0_g1~~TRINITY_DN3240_c0_g1_i2.p1  ORF type:complete len:567 (+),score=102.22 TRINITY_DN3240_c0_g1_i2:109-1809(+)